MSGMLAVESGGDDVMMMGGGTSFGGRVKDWKKGDVRNWKRLLNVSAEKVIFNESDTQSSTMYRHKKKESSYRECIFQPSDSFFKNLKRSQHKILYV